MQYSNCTTPHPKKAKKVDCIFCCLLYFDRIIGPLTLSGRAHEYLYVRAPPTFNHHHWWDCLRHQAIWFVKVSCDLKWPLS